MTLSKKYKRCLSQKGKRLSCVKDYYPRADYLEFENGYAYVCESD